MNGYQITFFTRPDHRHHDRPLAQWVFDQAMEMHVCGATLNFDRDGVDPHQHRPHEAHFPKLADQTVEVRITATAEKVDSLLEQLKAENVKIFYVRTPVEFGMLGDGP